MLRIVYIMFVGWLLAFTISCNSPNIVPTGSLSINVTDTALKLVNAVWFYKTIPFTGELNDNYSNGANKSIRNIKNGKPDGLSQTFYPDGKPETWRWYKQGEKDSVHTGWWPAGNKRFEYHFTNGNYNGLFTEWYQDGKMIDQILYDNGQQVNGKGWRDNGKLYLNFIVKNGRYYGLMNSNLCYSLNNQTVK